MHVNKNHGHTELQQCRQTDFKILRKHLPEQLLQRKSSSQLNNQKSLQQQYLQKMGASVEIDLAYHIAGTVEILGILVDTGRYKRRLMERILFEILCAYCLGVSFPTGIIFLIATRHMQLRENNSLNMFLLENLLIAMMHLIEFWNLTLIAWISTRLCLTWKRRTGKQNQLERSIH